MFDDDRLYFQHRAEVEIGRAQSAAVPEAVRAHCQLAEVYLDKLAELEAIDGGASWSSRDD